MLSKQKIYDLIDFVVAEAAGYQVKVMVRAQAQGLTRFANSEIHQNVFEDETTFTISVSTENKRSEISTSQYDQEGLKGAVKDAIANLSFLPQGETQQPLVKEPPEITADNYNARLAQAFDVVQRAELVKQGLDRVEEGFLAYGTLSYSENQIVFGNSEGVKRYAFGNNVFFSVLVSSENGGSGFTKMTSTRPEDFDVLEAFSIACDKAKLNQNPMELPPGPYTVILEPLAVGDLLTFMSYIGFSAKSAQNQISFLTGKLGEKVFGDNISIVDDHTNENTVSLPFDFEGTPRQKVSIIEKGVAKGFVHDLASAAKDGVKPTGHSANMPQMGGIALNLIIDNGEKSLDDIIAETKDALLVTRFHYMNPVNPRNAQLTALTRDGVFKIEDGKIVGAVKNMRFTESMINAFNNVEEISKDRKRTPFFFGNYFVPGMKIKDFHFTGRTEA